MLGPTWPIPQPVRKQGAGSTVGPDLSVPSPLPPLVSKDRDVQSWTWLINREWGRGSSLSQS